MLPNAAVHWCWHTISYNTWDIAGRGEGNLDQTRRENYVYVYVP